MKYIKKFSTNESVTDSAAKNRESFVEFSNNYLAYLKDEGLSFFVNYPSYVLIDFDKTRRPFVDVTYTSNMIWGDFSDSFLSYFEALVENYKILGIKGDKVIRTFVKNGGISTEIHFSIKDFLDNNLYIEREHYKDGKMHTTHIPLDDYIMSQIKIRIYV